MPATDPIAGYLFRMDIINGGPAPLRVAAGAGRRWSGFAGTQPGTDERLVCPNCAMGEAYKGGDAYIIRRSEVKADPASCEDCGRRL